MKCLYKDAVEIHVYPWIPPLPSPPPLPQDQPSKYKQMVPTFVNLLQSALGRRLPKEMEYHGVPAPWAQIRLLKILAMLGADDPRWAGRLEPD